MAIRNLGSMQISESPAEQTRAMLREMADFIALYETIEEKLIAREIALEGKLVTGEKLLSEQLTKIKSSFSSFQAIMTEAGAARWRIAAESALREGKEHLSALQETSTDIIQAFKEGSEQLEKVANSAISGITEATGSFSAIDFTNTATKGCEQIKEASSSGIKRTTKLIKLFHVKNLFMCLVLTIFVIFLTGLYVNDEWPWEIHSQAAKERNAGQTLLAAWSYLTPAEQQNIIAASKKNAS